MERKADRVSRDLLERIVRGQLAVGALLPREDELAAEYGVNRSVIREAIKLLEVHRLVRPIRRRGTEVLDPLASLSPEVLRVMLTPRPGTIDLRVLSGLLDLRATVDVLMIGLAAERRTRADLAALDRCLDALAELRRDPAAYARGVDELDAALARAAGSPVFGMLVAWHAVATGHLQHVFAAVRPASEAHLARVREVVEAIRAKDAARARRLVERFHRWATPRLLAAAQLAGDGESGGQAPEAPTRRRRA